MENLSPFVVGLGQCAYDFLGRVASYPSVDQKAELSELLQQGGGPVATALVTLARLGVPTSFVGRVGDDSAGSAIREDLLAEGVDCTHLSNDPGRTSQIAFIAVEEGTGSRNIFWHRGTARPLSASEVLEEFIRGARVLHLDGLHHEPALAAARIARKHGVTTVLDGGTLRDGTGDLLPLIDHPVVSERFARQMAGDDVMSALEKLIGYGCEAATVTLGSRGSHTLTRLGESFYQPAFDVHPVDTTGCGDVFHGAYIFGLLQGWVFPRLIRFAAACSALKTRALGGRTAIPALPEIERFLCRI